MISFSIRTSKGFTLIELLVVIAIIGVLSSVILASLNVAREKGYDAKRFSDLRNVQIALQNYYADNGSYPTTSGVFNSNCNITPYTYISVPNNVIPNLVAGGYISSIPTGPQAVANTAGGTDCYAYKSNGTDYKFMDYGSANIPGAEVPTGALEDPDYGTSAWSVYSSTYAGLNF